MTIKEGKLEIITIEEVYNLTEKNFSNPRKIIYKLSQKYNFPDEMYINKFKKYFVDNTSRFKTMYPNKKINELSSILKKESLFLTLQEISNLIKRIKIIENEKE